MFKLTIVMSIESVKPTLSALQDYRLLKIAKWQFLARDQVYSTIDDLLLMLV